MCASCRVCSCYYNLVIHFRLEIEKPCIFIRWQNEFRAITISPNAVYLMHQQSKIHFKRFSALFDYRSKTCSTNAEFLVGKVVEISQVQDEAQAIFPPRFVNLLYQLRRLNIPMGWRLYLVNAELYSPRTST